MLDKTEYVDLSPEEQALLKEWLWFYQELVTGRRRPSTDAQDRFVQVSRGRAVAKSTHEIAYAKWMRNQALMAQDRIIPDEVAFDDRTPSLGWFTDEDWHKLRSRGG